MNNSKNQEKGQLILLLGPSGAGKGSILRRLRQEFPEAIFPVSCTTRDPRPGEKNGEVYYFITMEEFETRRDKGEFLEWAIVHGKNAYGTLKKEILDPIEAGKTVIREVDVQGLRSILELLPKNQVKSIFLSVESWDVLLRRIQARSPLSEEEIARRKASYDVEISWAEECDYNVLNKDGFFEETMGEIHHIITELQ